MASFGDLETQKYRWEQEAAARASAPPTLSPRTEKVIGVVAGILAVPLMLLFFAFVLLRFVTGG